MVLQPTKAKGYHGTNATLFMSEYNNLTIQAKILYLVYV